MSQIQRKKFLRAKSLDVPSRANIVLESSPGVFYDGELLELQYRKALTYPQAKTNMKYVRISIRKEDEMKEIPNQCSCSKKRQRQLSVVKNGIRESRKDPEVETEARILRRSSMRYIGHWYYPEGGWGWCVCLAVCLINILTTGLLLSSSLFLYKPVSIKFGSLPPVLFGLLTASPLCVSFMVSPITVFLATSKPVRMVAVSGSVFISLGLLFTSFSTQIHQLFISISIFTGVGVSVLRDTSTVILHQYFKKQKNIIELLVVSSTGVGVMAMSPLCEQILTVYEWRYGFQILSGMMSLTLLLALMFRPASLYHPQRRAMQHIKFHQKKILKKNVNTKDLGFFKLYYRFLTSRNVLLLMASTSIKSSGLLNPLYHMSSEGFGLDGIREKTLHLYVIFGCSIAAGSVLSGLLHSAKSRSCLIGIKYQVQSFLILSGICIAIFSCTAGYLGHVLFMVVYGVLVGGELHSIKLFVYSQTRRTEYHVIWGLVQFCMGVPIILGIILTSLLRDRYSYVVSGILVAVAAVPLCWTNPRNVRIDIKDRKPSKKSATVDEEDRNNVGRMPGEQEHPAPRNIEQFLFEDFLSSCNKVENQLLDDEFKQNMEMLGGAKEMSNIPQTRLDGFRRFSI